MRFGVSCFEKNCIYWLAFLPAVTVFLLMTIVTNYGIDSLVPVWGDEVAWWSHIRDLVYNINYPGHAGHNANYAKIGNYGAWGLATLVPYAVLGKVIGWDLYSMSICNMLLLGGGLVLFALLVKTNNKALFRIAICYLCMHITVGYTMTSMSESLRYSLTIILCGIVFWLNWNLAEYGKQIRYKYVKLFVIVLFVLYAVNVWLILSLFIPLIVWPIIRTWSTKVKIIVIPLVTLVVAAVEQYLLRLVSYSYFEPVFSRIIVVLKNEGILPALRLTISNAFANLQTFSLPHILKQGFSPAVINDALFMYFLLYLVLLIVCTVNLIHNKNYQNFLSLYLLIGFMLGYCTLYTGNAGTLCRGTNAGLFAVTLCACKSKGKIDVVKIIYIAGMIGIVASYNWYSWIITDRVNTAANTCKILEEQHRLAEVMEFAPENDAWDNTVAVYGPVDYWYLSMPKGGQINHIINGRLNNDARYVSVRTSFEDAKDITNMHIYNGHTIVFQDDLFTILRRDNKE